MLASKSEKDSLGAVLFFNIAHYVLAPLAMDPGGPVLVAGLPEPGDIQKAFPNLDPKLVNHDIAHPAMAQVPARRLRRPDGRRPDRGQFLHLLSLLNWALSYLVHDFYRRFIRRGDSEALRDGRSIATIVLFICSSGMVYLMESAKDNFDIMLQVGAAPGCSICYAGSGGGSTRGAKSLP